MISLIGVLLIIFAIGMYVVTKVITVTEKHTKLLREWNGKRSFMVGTIGFLFTIVTGMFFYNTAGTATSVQYLWGGDKAVTTQGLKLKLWGKTIPISFEIAMQDYLERRDTEGNIIDFPREEGIYYRKAQKMEFADAIKADIATSLVVSVNYSDEDLFLSMADKNRSEAKLVYARIYPVYDQALKNTCKLMDAQDYISGASSQFDYYLKDQMENGMYLTEEVYDDVEEENISGNDSTKTVVKTSIRQEKRRKKYKIKEDANGNPIRDKSNSLKRYGLKVEQAAVTNIDWEADFDERLKLQKEQVAQTQIEKQEAEKEFYATQKAIAKGEREKAETKVKYEKIQLEKTITAETKAKEAKYKEQEEINLLAAAKKEAQRIKITADAEAYEISKKVNAGITPEVRLKMELEAKVAMMKMLAGPDGITLPQTMFNGSNGSGNSSNNGLLESIIGAKILSGELGTSK